VSEPTRRLPLVGEDCWRTIGVMGDGTCAELLRVVHCNACPVLGERAHQLFARPAPPDYVEAWAERIAAVEDVRADTPHSALVFRIQDEWLALDTADCAFVSPVVTVRRLARRSGRVFAGLVHVRGEVLLAVSLRGLLGLPASNSAGRRFIGLDAAGQRWIFDVDEVHGVLRHGDADVSPAPLHEAASVVSYARGVVRQGTLTYGLLDAALLDGAFRRSLRG
jgi:chemotaxis-related protein WspD